MHKSLDEDILSETAVGTANSDGGGKRDQQISLIDDRRVGCRRHAGERCNEHGCGGVRNVSTWHLQTPFALLCNQTRESPATIGVLRGLLAEGNRQSAGRGCVFLIRLERQQYVKVERAPPSRFLFPDHSASAGSYVKRGLVP
jgi:hypothetical protein